MVREAMEAGAAGLSTGLEYAPGIAATAAELQALCEPVGAHGGLYATHCRNRAAGIVDAAREAATVALESGCRLQLSHFVRRVSSPADGGALERAAREHALEPGARAGVAVGFDVFPFTFGPTPLTELLPQAQRASTREEMAARLAAGIDDRGHAARRGARGPGRRGDVRRVRRRARPARRTLARGGGGRAWARRSRPPRSRCSPTPARTSTTSWSSSAGPRDDDLDRAMLDDDFCLMGDGVTGALDGPLAGLAFSLSDWGWVVRTLAHYVRDTNVLSLEAAVRRMTLAPASQLGLADRGALLPGMAADVAVFDLARVGTSVAPQQLIARPRGVEHVLVNGTPVVRHGEPTDARPGAIGAGR